MKNLSDLMKQAQEMQAKMSAVQAELEAMVITGEAAGGLVVVTLSGKGDMKAVSIDKTLLKPDEAEMVEDLIIAAHADARAKVERTVSEKMQKAAGGLPLPPGMSF